MRCRMRRLLRSLVAAAPPGGTAASAESVQPDRSIREAQGTITHVDLISRELVARVNDDSMKFYVPLDCKIVLNDEPVKLRLLQPMDRAKVVYFLDQGTGVARSVVVPCQFRPTVTGEARDRDNRVPTESCA